MPTVLVANRGEIARRVFRTAKRMRLRTVAVYSDADAGAPFVREADLALRLGPAAPAESYLSSERILDAAREAGADLIHPGYGFLAEDAGFARAVLAAGLRFVGPSPEVLAALGDKSEAKATAERAGVPVLPGHRGADQRDEAFVAAAAKAGYPVMVKPAAGGGGIGMRLVRDEASLRDALAQARRAATAAFGDERLLLERAVAASRHVEVQILADTHGTVVALGERDCSAQRRHQKLLEETPSPAVDQRRRERMRGAAIAIARASGYTNAGTVEFIVDDRGEFFFIEVNARLQVEHPITEAVHGIDLVEQQLRVALGKGLSAVTAAPRGCAFEARIYAEDPASGFLPSTGRLVHVRWPDGVRVDAGVEEGSVVTRHYDALLAKIVSRGNDRGAALGKLARALAETELLGVRTNVAFMRALVDHPDVRAGRVTTDLVERELPNLAQSPAEAADGAYAVAAAAAVATRPADARDAWAAIGPWRAGRGAVATVLLRTGPSERAVTVEGGGPYLVGRGTVAAADEPHRWTFDGETATAARDGTVWHVGWRGQTYELDTAPRERSVGALAPTEIVAPMPGVVLALHARAGQRVRRGQLVCLLEAMKMELRVEASADGTVGAVLCRTGEQVERGQRLVEFAAD